MMMLMPQATMEPLGTFTHCDHRDHNYHRCSSKSSEVSSLDDCESLDSCFVGPDPEEEFYSHDSSTPTPPTPSEDIWKKFELYPTPPLSPTHPEDLKATIEPLLNDEELDMLETDFLQDVADILMDGNDLPWMTRNCDFSEPIFRAPSPASPALIQDCMWSSFIAEERRKFLMKTEKKTEDKPKKPATSSTNTSTMMLPPLIPASEYGSSDCVDPSAVFPYPISETRLDLFSSHGSGSNTPSDSEEEIDVVTVEKKHGHHHYKTAARPHQRHQITKQQKPPQTQQAINITLLGKRGRPNTTVLTIPIKKVKAEANIEEVKQMLQKSSIVKTSGRRGNSTGSSRNSSRPNSRPSSHPSSDSEDTEKRACHNVLERKRREDLRTSFLLLRDEVPELNSSERAAKVVILKKATDYVRRLRDMDDSLKMELEMERRKSVLLRSRLESLLAPRPL